MRNIGFAAILLIASACSSAYAGAGVESSALAAECLPMQIGEIERDVSFDAVRVDPDPDSSLLSVIATRAIEGNCEYEIEAFDGSRILLASGETLQRADDGNFVPAEARYRYDTRLPVSTFADLSGDGFRFASPVGTWVADGVTYTHQLGVWEEDGVSYVRAFVSIDDRAVSDPQTVFTTESEVFALGLSPLPDAPMGSIHMAHQPKDAPLRLTTLNWNFSSYFEKP